MLCGFALWPRVCQVMKPLACAPFANPLIEYGDDDDDYYWLLCSRVE